MRTPLADFNRFLDKVLTRDGVLTKTEIKFDSYESAMENSNRPGTSEFAAKMAQLCDTPPRFYNLDVRRAWEPASSSDRPRYA